MSLLRWYEGQLVRIYEAEQIKTEDWYDDPKYHWWAKFVPTIIDPEWWRWYVVDNGDPGYPGRGPFQAYRFRRIFWLGRLICRMQNHPLGPVFYNPNGYEPDGRCKDCGQEIA